MRKNKHHLIFTLSLSITFLLCLFSSNVYLSADSSLINFEQTYSQYGDSITKTPNTRKDYDYTIGNDVDKTGKTDVSKAINSILSTASANGTASKPSVVYIPAGTYLFDNTSIIIGDNTILHLDDKAIIKRGSTISDNTPMLVTTQTFTGGYEHFKNAEIYGGIWDANQNKSTTTCSNGEAIDFPVFYIVHAQNVYIHNVTIQNARCLHSIVLEGCKNVTVSDSSFRNFYASLADSSINAMEAVHLDITNPTGSEAEPLDNTPCKNITIKNCTFDNVQGGIGAHHAEPSIPVRHSSISICNNTFNNLEGNSIDASMIDGAIISKNTLKGGKGDFINSSSSCNLQIEGNNIDDASTGIYLSYGNHGAYNNIINNNTIKNTKHWGIFTVIEKEFLSSADLNSSITVCNNTISNVKNYGIFVDGFKADIEKNTVDSVIFIEDDTDINEEKVSGIRIGNSKTGSSIHNNIIRNVSRGIATSNSENITINDNDISKIEKIGIGIIGSGYEISGNTIDSGENSILLNYYSSKSTKDVIKNNKISNAKKEGIATIISDDNKSNAQDNSLIIEGNSVSNVHIYGIRSFNYNNVSILNNNISNVLYDSSSDVQEDRLAGVKIEQANSGVNISNNIVTDTPVGLWTSACHNIDISSNSTSNTKTSGIKISKNSSNITISKNNIANDSGLPLTDNNSSGIVIADSETILISDNTIDFGGNRDIIVWGPTTSSKTTIRNNSLSGSANDRITCTSTNKDLTGNKIISENGSSDNKQSGKGSQDNTDQNDNKDKTESASSSDNTSVPKYCNEWINGKYYNSDGSQTYEATLQWNFNSYGWWVEDTSGWYPKSQWQKIDGKWYYFTETGYMDYSEYRDGCWLGSDGSWDESYYGGHWCVNGEGWWYEDSSGWYPNNQYVWIDGVNYWFNSNGYWN